MSEETRREYIKRILDVFLESSATHTKIDLYSSEIRRLENNLYKGKIKISKGAETLKTPDDKRYRCIVKKV